MTATLTAPVEALLREQVAKGHFPSLDRAFEVAVKTVDGRRASHALESLLDETSHLPANAWPSRHCGTDIRPTVPSQGSQKRPKR